MDENTRLSAQNAQLEQLEAGMQTETQALNNEVKDDRSERDRLQREIDTLEAKPMEASERSEDTIEAKPMEASEHSEDLSTAEPMGAPAENHTDPSVGAPVE